MFRQNMSSQFNRKNVNNNKLSSNKLDKKRKNILVEFYNLPTPTPVKLLSSVPPRLSKEELIKSKFYKKKEEKTTSQ